MATFKDQIISLLNKANEIFDYYDNHDEKIESINGRLVPLTSLMLSYKIRGSGNPIPYNHLRDDLSKTLNYKLNKNDIEELLNLLQGNKSDKDICDALTGVSEQPICYIDNEIYINSVVSIDRRYSSTETLTFFNIQPSKSVVKKLDMSIIPFKYLEYKCNCHFDCTDNCKQKCKSMCTCHGIRLPKIINFVPFRISEGNGKSIEINTYDQYLEYIDIPSRFRYKHKFINDDFVIDFNRYFKKLATYGTKYYFKFCDGLKISTNNDGHPFTKEVLDAYLTYFQPRIDVVYIECEEITTDEFLEIKNIIRKHSSAPIWRSG